MNFIKRVTPLNVINKMKRVRISRNDVDSSTMQMLLIKNKIIPEILKEME